MIKPGEVPSVLHMDHAQQFSIEQYIDHYLKHGLFKISRPRENWEQRNVNAVLDKYRAEGWTVIEDMREFRFSSAEFPYTATV
jgi:hypothetical protein